MAEPRTIEIEEIAARFCAEPLTAETVFLRPAWGPKKLEMCDLLLALRGCGVVLSLKCQADPSLRADARLAAWGAKNAKKAVGQIAGAVRTLSERPFWCQHWRRGRVDFAAGSVAAEHGVVVLEAGTTAVRLPDDLPDAVRGVPVAYVSLNDVLNLVDQLRSLPDLVAYLDARARLPKVVRRVIGNENLLFQYWAMHDESFDGCQHPGDLVTNVIVSEAEFRRRLEMKMKDDKPARYVEYVSDSLATRNPDYAVGLDAETLAAFDGIENRAQYVMVQEHLCDLRLVERRSLGGRLLKTTELISATPSDRGRYDVWMTSSKPDFVYFIAATRGIERAQLLREVKAMLLGAMAHFRREKGMAIIERDGVSYEVALAESGEAEPALVEAASKIFGSMKLMSSGGFPLLPEESPPTAATG